MTIVNSAGWWWGVGGAKKQPNKKPLKIRRKNKNLEGNGIEIQQYENVYGCLYTGLYFE